MVQFSQWPEGVSVVIQVKPAVFCTFLSFLHLPLLYSSLSSYLFFSLSKSSLSFPIPCLPPVLPYATTPPTHTLVYSHITFHLSLLFFPVLSAPLLIISLSLIDSLNNSSSFIFSSSPSYLPMSPSPLLYQLCSHYCCFTLSSLFSPPISSSYLLFGSSPFLSSMYSISG